MKVTNKLIKDLNPCKDRFDNYLNFYKGKKHTKAQFLGLKNITHEDKLWVAFRLIPTENIQLAAADIAELVLLFFEFTYPSDDRPRKAIEAARTGIGAYAAANAAYAAARAADSAADRAADRAADFFDIAANQAAANAANASANAAYAADRAAANAANAVAHAAGHAAYDAAHAAGHAANAVAHAAAYADARYHINKKIRTIVLKYWK